MVSRASGKPRSEKPAQSAVFYGQKMRGVA
jgi:hypothetical protein